MSVVIQNRGVWKANRDWPPAITYTVTFTIDGYEQQFSCGIGQFGGNTGIGLRTVKILPICGYNGVNRILWTEAQIDEYKAAFVANCEETLDNTRYLPSFTNPDYGWDGKVGLYLAVPDENPSDLDYGDEVTWTLAVWLSDISLLGRYKLLFGEFYSVTEVLA